MGKKKRMKNDRYDCNQGEERNPMGSISNKGAGRTQSKFTILSLKT
jgi:hypothetical protein